MARSGGATYRPTTSGTFSMKRESVDSLKYRIRCGLRRWVAQIRVIWL